MLFPNKDEFYFKRKTFIGLPNNNPVPSIIIQSSQNKNIFTEL